MRILSLTEHLTFNICMHSPILEIDELQLLFFVFLGCPDTSNVQ